MSLLSRMRSFRRSFKNPKVFSKNTMGNLKKRMSTKKKPASSTTTTAQDEVSIPHAISLPAPMQDASNSDLYRDAHDESRSSLMETSQQQQVNEESYLTEQSFASQSHNMSTSSASPILKAKESSLLLVEEEEEDEESFDVTQPFMSEQDESIVFSPATAAEESSQLEAIKEESTAALLEHSLTQVSAEEVEPSAEEVEPSAVADANSSASLLSEIPEEPVLSPPASAAPAVTEMEISALPDDSQMLNTSRNSKTVLRSGRMSALRVVLNNPKLMQQQQSSPSKAAPPAPEEMNALDMSTSSTSSSFKRLSNRLSTAALKLAGQVSEDTLRSGFQEIITKTYKEQAVRFLNAYWQQINLNAEQVWEITKRFTELSVDKDAGSDLDELKAHRVFEILGQALTITEMRTKLKTVRARRVSLSEFLVFHFQVEWRELVTAPQTTAESLQQMEHAEKLMKCSKDALAQSQEKARVSARNDREAGERAKSAAQAKINALAMEEQARLRETAASQAEAEASKFTQEAKEAFETCAEKAALAKQSEQDTYEHLKLSASLELEAKRGEEIAQQAEAKALEQENQAREAESEAFRKEKQAQTSELLAIEAEKALVEATERVAEALNKVKAEEAQFAANVEQLRVDSEDMTKGLVARRKAKHELEVLLANNPDHLQQARIGEEAIVRKHDKLVKNASMARHTSSVNRQESEKLKKLAIEFRATCEQQASEAQIRRSASETKAKAAAEARALCEQAQAKANEELKIAEEWKRNADEALAVAQTAKLAASEALKESMLATQDATASRQFSESQEQDAVLAKKLAEESRHQADLAVVEAIKAFEDAQLYVDRVKLLANSGQGGWWWASREIDEAKKFVPQKKMKKMGL